MAIHHLGPGICSQILRMACDILYVHQPATIMTSDCLGENLITSDPKRAASYRGPAKAIISMAQHASPIGMGHAALARAQLVSASSLVVRKPCSSAPSKLIIAPL